MTSLHATTVCTWSVPVTMLVTCDRVQRCTWQFYHRYLVSYACKQLALTPKCIAANSSTDSASRSMPLSTFLWSNKSPALPTMDHRCDVTSHLSSIVGSADDLFDHRIQLGVDVLVAVQMHGLVVEGLEQQLIALGYLDHNLFVDVKATRLDT